MLASQKYSKYANFIRLIGPMDKHIDLEHRETEGDNICLTCRVAPCMGERPPPNFLKAGGHVFLFWEITTNYYLKKGSGGA